MKNFISTQLGNIVFLCITILSATVLLYANQNGAFGLTKKSGGSGCYCHNNSPSAGVTVTIIGPETLMVNQVGSYTVRITGGPAVRGGVDIAASTGTITAVAGQGLKAASGDLTHTTPKQFSGGVLDFAFTYKAPATTGNRTLYAAGNSVNFNNSSGGDAWNHAPNKTIVVVPLTAVGDDMTLPDEYSLNQNYPNPFNPSTSITYQLKGQSAVSLKIYNTLGEEVASLVNGIQEPGFKTQTWDAANAPSGVYYYKLDAHQIGSGNTANFSEMKKMLLVR